jgi:beta-phosphoglucomutase
MASHVHGRTNRTILEYLLNREIPDDVLQFFVVKKEDFYKYMCLQDTKNLKLVEGAAALLDYLTQSKIKINIATSSEITNLQFFIEQFHLEMWFDINKIIYDDFKIKGKPSPDMYLVCDTKPWYQTSRMHCFRGLNFRSTIS